MHAGTTAGIGFDLAQHLARDRRGIALAERQELQQVGNRVALGPPEVDVRDHAGLIADVEQQRRDRVGNRRALRAQNQVAAHLDALHPQHVAELGRIAWLDFQEQHRLVGRHVVRIAGLAHLVLVLRGQARPRPVGDDPNRTPAPGDAVDERPRRSVELEAVDPQLGGPQRPRHERGEHDREDEDRRDLDPFGPLDHVGDRGVDEDRGNRQERDPAVPRAPGDHRNRQRARGHEHQHTGGIRAALGLDAGLEHDRDHDRDPGDDDDQRTVGPRPLRGHAEARQIARHQREQAGHRR